MAASKNLLYVILITVLGIIACEKDPPETGILPEPEKPMIRFRRVQSADATLQATYLSTIVDSGIIGNITYLQGIAFAELRNSSGQIISSVNISSEGTPLTFNQGIYRTYPGNTQGLDFGSIVTWKVTGHPQIPDIDEGIQAKVPEIGDVNVKDSIHSQKELWLGIDLNDPFTSLGPQIDSVRFLLIGKTGSLTALTSSTDSISFPQPEVAGLGKGKAYLYAEAWFTTFKTYSGYRVAFVNKGVLIKEAWIY